MIAIDFTKEELKKIYSVVRHVCYDNRGICSDCVLGINDKCSCNTIAKAAKQEGIQ